MEQMGLLTGKTLLLWFASRPGILLPCRPRSSLFPRERDRDHAFDPRHGSRSNITKVYFFPSFTRLVDGQCPFSSCEPELIFEHVRGAERMSPVSRESRPGLT